VGARKFGSEMVGAPEQAVMISALMLNQFQIRTLLLSRVEVKRGFIISLESKG